MAEGRLRSVDEVKIELDAQDDYVAEWAGKNEQMFVPLEEDIQIAARNLLADHPTLVDLRKRKGSADPFLIGAAQSRGGVVVTEEKPSGGPGRVKIPNVCDALNIECVPLLELIKREGLQTH